MKKKFLVLLIVALMLISSVGTVFAAEDRVITVFVDGEQIQFDVPPISENGRTLVPMRYIFEALGAEVNWIPEENKAVATKGDITVEIVLGNNIMTKNGKEITLDVPAKAINGRILVPARAVSEALDAVVNWIGEEYKVDIVSAKSEPEIVNATEAEARKVLEEYIDAATELDIRKMCTLTAGGEEDLESLPEGDFADILVASMFCMIEDTDQLVELPEGYMESIEQYIKIILNGFVEAYTKDVSCKIVDVREENGIFIYTLETTMPNLEMFDDEALSAAITKKLGEDHEKIEEELKSSGKITDDMTDDEKSLAMLEPVGYVIAEILKEEIAKFELTIITEEITLANNNGKWQIEDTDFDISSIDDFFNNLDF